MATEVKRRRGSTSDHLDNGGFTGAIGEITVDTTTNSIRVHDNDRVGGYDLLRSDFNNIPTSVSFTSDLTVTGEIDATKFSGDLTGAIHVQGKNNTGGTLTKGTPVYISGQVGAGQQFTIAVADADDSAKMPCIGILAADVNANGQGDIVTHGKLIGIDTSSFTVGDELYISSSGTLVSTPPTGESNLLQKIAKVIRVDSTDGQIYIMGAGRTNAVPNLDQNKIFLGDSNNQAVATALSSINLSSFNDDVVSGSYLPLTGGTISSNLVISGNLTVSGTTTTVNTETINLADNIITLNSNFTGNNPTENAGIEIERGDLTNKSFFWNEATDQWNADSALVATSFIKQSNSGGFLKADGTEDTSTYLTTVTEAAVLAHADNYANWTLTVGATNQDIGSGDALTLTAGTGISLSISGANVTIDSTISDGDITAVNTQSNSGLSGGSTSGDIDLSLDISNLTAITTADSQDPIAILDGSTTKKITLGNIPISAFNDDSTFLKDADFTSNGFLKRTGDGTYTVDTNTYLTSETSHSDVVVDGDFTTAGFMKTDGSGTYSVDGSTYLTSVSSSDVTQHLSVVTQTATGGGELSLVNGEFRFKPAAVSSFIALTDLSAANDTLNTSASGSLSYNSADGTFTFTPPDLSGFLTSLPSHNHNDLYYTESEIDGFLGNKDNYDHWTISDGTNSGDIDTGATLTVAAGTGITTTYDSSTQTFTIASTLAGGDITAVNTAAGSGLSGGASTGAANLQISVLNLTDMTADVVGGDDELIIRDASETGNQTRRKAISEIKLSQFNNDAGFITSAGDITEVTAGDGLSGGGTSGSVTISHADTSTSGGLDSTGNSNGTVIQNASVSVDTYGHVTTTSVSTINLDNRYLQLSGGTLTGSLTVQSVSAISTAAPKFQLIESDTTDENKEILLSGGDFFIRNLNDDGTVPSNENILKISHEGVVTLLAQGTTTATNLNALFQDGNGVLKRRTLGSNAFNSTAFLTSSSFTVADDDTNTTDVATNGSLTISGGTGIDVAVTTGTVTITSTVTDTDTNTFVNAASFNTGDGVLTLTKNNSSTVTADLDGRYLQLSGGTISQNLIISGNLTVSGTTTTVNTETIKLADNIIMLNSNFEGETPSESSGIEIERGPSNTNKQFLWNETNDRWQTDDALYVSGALTATGNVGIGTDSPAHKLDLSDSSTTWAAKILNTNDNGQGLLVRSDTTNDDSILGVYGNGSYRMIVKGDGNVGIGTTSPATKLSVGSENHISPNDTDRILAWYTPNTEVGNSSHALTIGFDNNATDHPRNVGLSLFNNSTTANTFSPALTFGGLSTSGDYMNGAAAIAAQLPANADDDNFRGGNLIFYTQGTTTGTRGLSEKMRIDASGNVGIGTTSPSVTLQVEGSGGSIMGTNDILSYFKRSSGPTYLGIDSSGANLDSGIRFGNNGAQSWTLLSYKSSTVDGLAFFDHSSSTFPLILREGGNVGIGTTSPATELDVEGTITSNNLNLQNLTSNTSDTAVLTLDQGQNVRVRTLGANAFNSTTIPTNNNQLTNGAGYITSFDITTQTDPKYLRSDADDTTTGNITIAKDAPVLKINETSASNSTQLSAWVSFQAQGSEKGYVGFENSSTDYLYLVNNDGRIDIQGSSGIYLNSDTDITGDVDVDGNIQLNGNYLKLNEGTNAESRIVSSANYLEIIGNGPSAASGARMWLGKGGTVDSGFYVNGSQLFFRGLDSSTKMYINGTSGNVGIGTTSPDQKFHVLKGSAGSVDSSSSAIITAENSTNGYISILVPDANESGVLFGRPTSSADGGIIYNHSNTTRGLQFRTAGNSTKMVIDSNGKVGIGTTSPQNLLHVNKSDSLASAMQFTNSTTGATSSDGVFVGLGSGEQGYFWNYEDNDLILGTSNAERLRIDSSGNVGIGTTSPLATLHLSTTTGGQIYLEDSNSGDATNITEFSNNGGNFSLQTRSNTGTFVSTDYQAVKNSNGTDYHRWFTNGSNERMRIDSSGNVLVGKTDTSSAVVGTTLWNGGYLNSTVDNDYVARFNRNTSDGDIVQFRKDNTQVGSIGSQGGDSLIIGSGDTGLLFSSANDAIHAWNTSTNGSRDNAIDLGRSSQRFKDLYLGGDAFVGDALEVGGTTTADDTITVAKNVAGNFQGLTINNSRGTLDETGNASMLSFQNNSVTSGEIRSITTEDFTTSANQSADLAFYTRLNGTLSERVRINDDGNVGIGTTSPDRNLHIETSGDSYVRVSGNRGNSNDLHIGNIEFENTFGSAGVIAEMRAITGNSGTQSTKGQLAFYTDDGSTYAERMRINSSGNVGIGATNPVSPLTIGDYLGTHHVNSATLPNTPSNHLVNLTPPSTTNYYGGGISWSEGTNTAASINTVDAGAGGALHLTFATGNNSSLSERMRIDTNGNVGIGTTSVTGKFNSYISAARQLTHNGNGGDLSIISDNNSTPVMYIKGTGTADLLNVFDNTTEVFTILDGGNVGIGTNSPDSILEIAGTTPTLTIDDTRAGSWESGDKLGTVSFRTSDGSAAGAREVGFIHIENEQAGTNTTMSGAMVFGSSAYNASATERMRIDSNGNVGIGTTDPKELLHIYQQGVVGNYYDEGALQIGGTTNSLGALLTYHSQNSGRTSLTNLNNAGGADATVSIGFGTINTSGRPTKEVLTVTQGSRVGIGESTPSGALHIKVASDTSDIQLESSGGSGRRYEIQSRTDGSFTIFDGTGSTERMRINSSGDVGIGTNSPNAKLHVSTGTTGTIAILEGSSGRSLYTGTDGGGHYIESTGTQASQRVLRIQASDGGSNYTQLFIDGANQKIYTDSATNVGIGTADSGAKLTVAGSAISIQTDGQGITIFYLSADHRAALVAQTKLPQELKTASAPSGAATGDLRFTVNSGDSFVDGMYISTTGNVGIGTTNPSAKLDVAGDAEFADTVTISDNVAGTFEALVLNNLRNSQDEIGNAAKLSFQHNSVNAGEIRSVTTEDFSTSANRSADLTFHTVHNGTLSQRLTINDDGNIGVGTDSPSQKLHVYGENTVARFESTSSYVDLYLINSGNTGFLNLSSTGLNFFAGGGSGADLKMFIGNSGNIGIGNTSPDAKLNINGYLSIDSVQSNPSTVAGEYRLALGHDATTDASWIQSNGASGTQRKLLLNPEGGNVGIGTASPTSISGYTALEINNATNGAILDLSQSDTMRGRFIATSTTLSLETSGSIPIIFQPAGSEAMRIDSDGLKFNGDTATANALDDYEEGTFTPTIHAGASNITAHSNNYGKYTKIGNIVHCSGRFQSTSLTAGSSSTNVELGGLPFSAVVSGLSSGTGCIAGSIGFASGFSGEAPTAMQIRNNEPNAFLYFQNEFLGFSNLKGNDLGSATTIVFQITYQTS